MAGETGNPNYLQDRTVNSDPQQLLAELDRKIKAMQAAGNRAGEAALRSQKALLYTLWGNTAAAASTLADVRKLANEAGRIEDVAKTYYTQGKTLLLQPEHHRAARDAFEEAAALYKALANYPQTVTVLKELAALEAVNDNMGGAVDHITQAIHLSTKTKDKRAIADLLVSRSTYRLYNGDIEAGLADLAEARDLAEQGNYTELTLTIGLHQQVLQGLTPQGVSPDALDTLRQEATQAGNFQIAGEVQLQQAKAAAQQGQMSQALKLAKSARQAAVKSTDLMRHARYATASMMIASILDTLGERVQVLYNLLTCKIYLETHVGQVAGQQINQLLDALREEWGEPVMRETINEYQAWLRHQQQEAPVSPTEI